MVPGPATSRRFSVRSLCVPPVVRSVYLPQGTAALQQTSVSQLLRACGKCVGGAAPPQVAHVLEKTRVRPERGEIFEQQRPVAAVSQYVRWESLDRSEERRVGKEC